ncbi:MAG: DUF4290 domain-containing protein [Paludibacteraceae bacterium]|nr:DUF4290 domain-containing protein [Paludibacteraceae bacterium]
MNYSAKEGPIKMPEYGRNIQRMVEYALTIEDKEERTRCVQAIMRTMSNLFPYLRNEESKHKMYDHLAMMSDFKLDVDSPFSSPMAGEMRYTPERLPYNTEHRIRYRHYGKILTEMIDEAAKESDKEKQKAMIVMIANRMKQDALLWNSDNVEDSHIKNDIEKLSEGKLNCDFEEFRLTNSKSLVQGQSQQGKGNQKRRKKKK